MNHYLTIDTATKNCSVAIYKGPELLHGVNYQEEGYAHSEKLLTIIQDTCDQARIKLEDLTGVVVSNGPGSYTGLRIGASAVKGIAYAFNIPVYTISSLEVLYYNALVKDAVSENTIIMAMIDARRDEVYLGEYNVQGESLSEESAKIIDQSFFDAYKKQDLLLVGDGAEKFKDRFDVENVRWSSVEINQADLLSAFIDRIERQEIQAADTAYFAPNYVKNYQPGKRKKIF